jgi:hypothetical protein
MKRLEKRLDLGLSVLVSRRSQDLFFKGLGLVSVSRNLGGSRSWSRLGLKTKCLGLEAQGLVYIPGFYRCITKSALDEVSCNG